VADAGEGNESEYELTRLLRAKFNPAAAEDLIRRIKHHLEKRHGNTDLNGIAHDAV
jgi:hypothetical protein